MILFCLKSSLFILVVAFCTLPYIMARGFTINFPDFNSVYDDFFTDANSGSYNVEDTTIRQDSVQNVKTDNLAQANQVITATQPQGVVLNIDKAYFSYAESKYGIFAFNPGLKFGYSYFNGKNGYEINYHKAYFSFPLDFSFYIAETRKVTVFFGPYYSFEFLKFQEEYKNPEIYRENHIGLDAEIKFSQNVSSFLDLGFALGALYSFNNDSFPQARAGVSLDWRL